MRRTAEEAAQTRAELLDAALFVFAEQGLASARLADVAQRAGLTRGALYHHFADKSALHAAVMTHSWTTLTEPVWEILNSRAPLDERLHGFLTTWLRRLRQDDRFRALLTLTVQGSYQAGSSDGQAAKSSALADWRQRLQALFAGHAALAPGRRPGGADAHQPLTPESAAAHLLAWLCGTALLAATDPALLPPGDADGVAPALRGLLPPEPMST
ncbi:TetR/AcrR family transcriptional regulator [Streptomyces lydicus]|nr:TetR/AcrR family transcriptional regulator [Streptomyces lydicus]